MKASFCKFCSNSVHNRCIHESQVKFCRQRSMLSASEIYGQFETSLDGVPVSTGIGPVSVTTPFTVDQDFVTFNDGPSVTKVRISSISI